MAEAAPPLIAVAGAPVPPGLTAAWVAGAGGVSLRTALLPAVGAVRGSVVVNAGRTESLEKYFETARELAARGFNVLLHDWRGQGLSGRLLADPLRGHVQDFDDYLADLRAVLEAYENRLPRPWIGVAHSMGATLMLLAVAKGEARFRAALLVAPMFGIAMTRWKRLASGPLSGLAHAFGRGGDYVLGQGARLPTATFEGNPLTHDPARYRRTWDQLQADPKLALAGPTWTWLRGALRAMAWLRSSPRTAQVTIPVTILSAEQDSIVDNAAQALIAARLPRGRLVDVPGALHEILQETDDRRAVFFEEFDRLVGEVAPRSSSRDVFPGSIDSRAGRVDPDEAALMNSGDERRDDGGY